MKKKLLTILCLLMCILLLASCDRARPDKETGSESGTAAESENLTDGMTEETQDDKKDDDPDNDYDVIIPDTEKPDATDSNTETEATESDTTVASDSQTESSTETVGETDHEHIYGEGTVIPPTFDAGGYTEYVCEVCGEKKQDNITDQLTHSYSGEWTFDETSHWRVCTDEGYADLKTDEGEHTIKEEIVKDSTAEETGTLRTSCTTCTYYFDTVIPRKTHIVSAPTVDADKCYVGMTLSSVPLIGGEGSVNGSFSWSYPDTIIAEKGDYEVTFTPSDPDDAAIKTTISISANWFKVNLIVGENGTATVDGGNKVSYNGSITVKVEPKFGYLVDVFTVNGITKTEYTIKNVKEDLTVNVSFKKSPNPVSVNCLIGNDGCYSISGGTLTITGITSNTVYTISGEAVGNIVIDVDPAYTFELELNGFKITSNTAAPISVINGDKVTISAKKSYTNYVIDNRDSVSGNTPASFPAAIYSLIDLDIEGKGILNVTSENNGGIYTKKDVEVKNLTLSVNCSENALRGNDSVEIVGGSLTLIATRGDAIRTNNSDISSKGNQRGNVTITGGVHNIYAAGDGISAAHDVIVSNATTTLNIFTDTYSTYTKLRTDVSGSKIYIRSETNECSYSLAFKTKNGYEWSDATYIGQEVIDGTTYHFYEAEKKSGYTHVAVYAYTEDQEPGQSDDYHLTTYDIPAAKGFDTLAIKHLASAISFRYTNYKLVEDGTYTVDERSNRGIKSANSISISEGVITIKSHGDAIKANNDSTLENGNTPTGNITITGGKIDITTYATGILAEGDLIISAGTVTVNESFTGLSGDTVDTTGAKTSIIATYKSVRSKK